MSHIQLQHNVPITPFTTLKLGGNAELFTVLKNTDTETLKELYLVSKEKNVPLFFLGGGSNIVCTDSDLHYLFVKVETKGITIISENDQEVFVEVQAGEIWDHFVLWSVEHGFAGIEALSAIPGTVGAAPVQNIGAYGAEVKNIITEVRTFNFETGKQKIFSYNECAFSYRHSVFKTLPRGQMLITSVVFRLQKNTEPEIPSYKGVGQAVKTAEGKTLLHKIRNAIIAIRWSKLPKPEEIPNVGSFFKNPIIDRRQAEDLLNMYPDMPIFNLEVKDNDQKVKIAAGWLIEHIGLKGSADATGQVGTYDKNALVLINKGNSAAALLAFARTIKNKIKDAFDIDVEIEPEIII